VLLKIIVSPLPIFKLAMTIFVTGSADFIGVTFVLDWLTTGDEPVINIDKLTYAGNPVS
jgi:dTDP-glucose 4,6-dehydratase